MEKTNLITAKEARNLTLTSTSFKTNLFKAIKHEALSGHNTLWWEVYNIDPQVIEDAQKTLLSLGYEIITPSNVSEEEDNDSTIIITW